MGSPDDQPPWADYDKDPVWQGWAYPLGRDRLAAALDTAGAHVDHLSLVGGTANRPTDGYLVLDVLWSGDARTNRVPGILQMRVWAVPADQRAEVREALEAHVLERACAWAAAARDRGNAWTASQHSFVVTRNGGRLTVAED
jgi:hypothetical protein